MTSTERFGRYPSLEGLTVLITGGASGIGAAMVLTNVDSSLAYYNGDGRKMSASTQLRITPGSLAWTDEDRLFLITRALMWC